MTQEILDYCLIKANLILLPTEQILESLKTKEQLENWCLAVISVIESDHLFMIDQKSLLKIKDVISKNRFLYPHDPLLCCCFNKIIDFCNVAMNQDQKTLYDMTSNWLQEEIIIRQLPRISSGYSVNDLLVFNQYDYCYLVMLLTGEKMTEFSAFPFLSTLNWVLNMFPEFFTENPEVLHRAHDLLTFCEDRKSGTEKKLRKVAKLVKKRIDKIPDSASNDAI